MQIKYQKPKQVNAMRKNKKNEPEIFKKEELAVINKSMDFLYRNDKSITEREKTEDHLRNFIVNIPPHHVHMVSELIIG